MSGGHEARASIAPVVSAPEGTESLSRPSLPSRGPFALRARLLTPLETGGTRHEADGLVVVDDAGRITFAGQLSERARCCGRRPRPPPVGRCCPGMVDLHAHLPQIPNAGLGAGLDLLTWLERYIFPLERDFDEAAAEALAPVAWRSFASAGTTTALVYGAVYEASLDASFRAAEAHGIRAIVGKVMMDRGTYDPIIKPADILDQSLRESAISSRAGTVAMTAGCSTPSRRGSPSRARPSCCASPRRSAASTGAYWQTHVSEDRGEIAEVARLFPEALDYVDVYDRAGGLGRRPCWRTRSTCPTGSWRGSWRPARTWRTARPPTCSSPRGSCRWGATWRPASPWASARMWPAARTSRSSRRCGSASTPRTRCGSGGLAGTPAPTPLDWIRMGSLDGARALGLDRSIGSLEAGKEADVIAVDPAFVAAVPGGSDDDPEDLASRLIFRSHPDMVRAAWVRGRRLEGPGPADDAPATVAPAGAACLAGRRRQTLARRWFQPSGTHRQNGRGAPGACSTRPCSTRCRPLVCGRRLGPRLGDGAPSARRQDRELGGALEVVDEDRLVDVDLGLEGEVAELLESLLRTLEQVLGSSSSVPCSKPRWMCLRSGPIQAKFRTRPLPAASRRSSASRAGPSRRCRERSRGRAPAASARSPGSPSGTCRAGIRRAGRRSSLR